MTAIAAALVALLALAGCGRDGERGAPPVTGMTLIPAGEFVMGSLRVDDEGIREQYGFTIELFLNEHPEHRVRLDDYYIDDFEVTNAQYRAFVRETGRPEPAEWVQNAYNVDDDKLKAAHVSNLRWIAVDYFNFARDPSVMDREALIAEMIRIQRERDRLPVTAVSWFDAEAYCAWRGKRLPTEAEWEKAARGTDGREYPWGDEWIHGKANSGDQAEGDDILAPVGSYPGDVSPYGVHDMAGNVSEWVADWYLPYDGAEYWHEAYGQQRKVVRGGGAGLGHYALSIFFRAARRAHAEPEMVSTDVGLRCAKDVAAS
jgi:formylglycine-generating enzyme required for sulfatase activity